MRRLLSLLRAFIHEATAPAVEIVVVFDGGPLDGLTLPVAAVLDRAASVTGPVDDLRPGLTGSYRHRDGTGHVRLVTA